MPDANQGRPANLAEWRSLKFSGFADFSLRMWAAKPLSRGVISGGQTVPSHLAKRMMLNSSASRRMPKEAGSDHQHLQSCVAIPATSPAPRARNIKMRDRWQRG